MDTVSIQLSPEEFQAVVEALYQFSSSTNDPELQGLVLTVLGRLTEYRKE